ncbi:sucrase ferredoxin [Pseudonocardia xinjiangensis]|uniref:sucrase ferredoxin n=1 Tax=Pseudonocardia xinjiangensis TaxID=75289 RepID=UPI003D91F668
MDAGTETGERCAALARSLDEPLAGTAPVAPRWVCVEHRGAWPQSVENHPDPTVAAFAAHAAATGWRLLLVRRPGRRGDGPARVYLTDTAPAAARTTLLTVAGPSELGEVVLPAAGAPLPGGTVTDPLLMVCTHGRRDRCCALDGRALALGLMELGGVDVWECSHLGGHRFAPTALVLPTGYAYGRLDPAAAVAALKAAGSDEVETALCRGRSTWSPAGQVAELAVRAATGLRDAHALEVADDARNADGGGTVVVSARDGRRWAVDVAAAEGSAPRPASCGADALPYTALRATEVRPLDGR